MPIILIWPSYVVYLYQNAILNPKMVSYYGQLKMKVHIVQVVSYFYILILTQKIICHFYHIKKQQQENTLYCSYTVPQLDWVLYHVSIFWILVLSWIVITFVLNSMIFYLTVLLFLDLSVAFKNVKKSLLSWKLYIV